MQVIPLLIAAFVAELKKEFPSGLVPRADLMEALYRYCHRNIQFYRALRESVEFRNELCRVFSGYCTGEDLQKILDRAAISVVIEEYPFQVGRYPPALFIRTKDEQDKFIDDLMQAPAGRPPRRNLADARFFCVGSCFATNVAYYLSKVGASIHTTVLAESINSPRNNVDLFHFFETGERRGLLLRDEVTESIGVDDVRKAFLASDTLILTLGCAYSLVSAAGEPLGRMEAGAQFDRPTVAGIVEQLRHIVGVCERHGFRELYVTVSPVPLSGTLVHGLNPFVSDSASKAMLRAAVEELVPATRVQYIPSFEVFRQGALHTSFPTFGQADGNSRHVNPDMTERVIRGFVANNFVLPDEARAVIPPATP